MQLRGALARVLFALAALAVAPAGEAAAAPAASFLWFPPSPHVGETVSLASTSTDDSSPITSQAWDLLGSGPFDQNGPVVETIFSTPGPHLVRLLVNAADGSGDVAAEVIPVTYPPAREMLPFPIVRIAGTAVRAGAKLRVLSVEAPPGVLITLECLGRGCPVRLQSRIAPSSGLATVTVRFRRFERFLPAGLSLEVRVSKAGQIGKDTRVLIRHGKAPRRVDSCLSPVGNAVISCPSTAGA
ncbi:MAG: PKD domain-containing protein [Actinobacteria bacterium]|nr:MAG: PKD domain-containing protein [Actinomycetota bacterium]